MNNADMPAMPTEKKVGDATYTSDGLTKREYFAGLAMQGLITAGYCIDDLENRVTDPAGDAVILADALLAELGRQGGDK